MTTLSEARLAIESHFDTAWAARTQIAWDNVDYTPTVGTDYVRFHIEHGEGEQISIGSANRLFRRTGKVVADVYVQENTGPTAATQHADAVMAIFEGLVVQPAGVRFAKVSPGEVSNDESGWFTIHITADFRFDEIK